MILKVVYANSVEQSDQGPHSLPVCRNRFGKFARIFSRQHKLTTFSDAGFLDILRVNDLNTDGSYTVADSNMFLGQ